MERRAIAIQGIVQGVGFRPFVYGLARRLALRGSVKNRTGGVLIEVEGETQSLDCFLAELAKRSPPLARIDQVSWERQAPRGERQFRIESSEPNSTGPIFIGPDVATCPDCRAELFDPADRRYQYPFLNCTNCGPRLTIICGAPYDRERTTMAAFALCAACRAEYEDPANRRFHAQPTACAACGPRLQALDAHGKPLVAGDPLAHVVARLRAGDIAALKGLGGYHLVCDASNETAVAELRRCKHRDEKPFALMVRDLEGVEVLCLVIPAEKELLLSPRCPIVLLRKRPAARIAEGVAPGNPYLGVMLPYTPLHHLLLHRLGGMTLVMTSGNRSDEPIAYEDTDAVERLAGIADLFLVHDRPIHVRCDDSVTRIVGGGELPVRRSRGYAPQPIALPISCPCPVLAVGGQLKATFALGRQHHAFLSHHLGDLDDYAAYRAFEKDIALYQQLFAIQPQVIAHDLHPDYASTRYAVERARAEQTRRQGDKETRRQGDQVINGVQSARLLSPSALETAPVSPGLLVSLSPCLLLAVQHHHAHMASCMAENGLIEPVIGVAFDGTGYGTDGTIWGGEFLVGDYRHFRRAAHLRYVGMPGGEQAIREPWRMAVAHLADAEAKNPILEKRLAINALRTIKAMLERHFQTPSTSSAGRLFDAVASLAGVRDRVSYEGQAAMELEWLATGIEPNGAYPFEIEEPKEAPLVIDTRLLIRAVSADVMAGTDKQLIARRFHSTMLEIIAAVCCRLRKATGLAAVVLSGGVFMNALLTCEVTARLSDDGFRVFRHRLVPPNDGGLSLGQLAIAAVRGTEFAESRSP